MDSASLTDPSDALAINSNAFSLIFAFSFSEIFFKKETISSSLILLKSNL